MESTLRRSLEAGPLIVGADRWIGCTAPAAADLLEVQLFFVFAQPISTAEVINGDEDANFYAEASEVRSLQSYELRGFAHAPRLAHTLPLGMSISRRASVPSTRVRVATGDA